MGILHLTPVEFWELTVAEFIYLIAGYQERERRKINAATTLAYKTALFQRQEKLPTLDSLLIEEENSPKEKRMTDEEMLVMMKDMAMVYGWEVKKI